MVPARESGGKWGSETWHWEASLRQLLMSFLLVPPYHSPAVMGLLIVRIGNETKTGSPRSGVPTASRMSCVVKCVVGVVSFIFYGVSS